MQQALALTALFICVMTIAACGPSSSNTSLTEEAVTGAWVSDGFSGEITVLKPDGGMEVYYHKIEGDPKTLGEWEIRDDGFYWCFTQGTKSDGTIIDYVELDGGKQWMKLNLSVGETPNTLVITKTYREGVEYAEPVKVWTRVSDAQ